MSDRLTSEQLTRFAYGQADDLEELVLSDDTYIAFVEEIWSSEMTDLTAPIMRAIHVERLIRESALAALDTGARLLEAGLHYLAGPDRQTSPDESEPPETHHQPES